MGKLLTIDRSKWLCGHELNRSIGKESMLLNQKGEMCCLGFLGKECGLSDDVLEEKFTPDSTIYEPWPRGVISEEDYKDSSWTAVAVRVNDSKSLSDTDREFILLDHFKAIGYTIEYIGSYQDTMYNGFPIK